MMNHTDGWMGGWMWIWPVRSPVLAAHLGALDHP
jgi:hypothetical protein